MDITKEVVAAEVTMNLENSTTSIAMDTIIKEDGVEISRTRHREAFVPGDIEKVKGYTGKTTSKELTYLKSMWTAEAITAHKAEVAESELR